MTFNDKMTAYLFNAAKGDLILNRFGNLCARSCYHPDTLRDLPFNEHTPGVVLATIDPQGWQLTEDGAEWILENCPPSSVRDVNRLKTMTPTLLQRVNRINRRI